MLGPRISGCPADYRVCFLSFKVICTVYSILIPLGSAHIRGYLSTYWVSTPNSSKVAYLPTWVGKVTKGCWRLNGIVVPILRVAIWNLI